MCLIQWIRMHHHSKSGSGLANSETLVKPPNCYPFVAAKIQVVRHMYKLRRQLRYEKMYMKEASDLRNGNLKLHIVLHNLPHFQIVF